MVAKVFAVPFALNGNKDVLPVAAPSGGEVSYDSGFGPDYERQLGIDPLAKNILREDFNGLNYDITIALQEMQAGYGTSPWNLTLATALPGGGYPVGALIPRLAGTGFWMNTITANITNPDAGGAGWVPFSGSGSDFAIATGTANTYVCAFTPAIIARAEGQVLKFKVKTSNAGASTFNDGLGVVALVGGAQAALQG